ncbi:MAG: GDSL-type esterase/lipase family protein [Bryobacteraceae bacterium]
MRIAALLALAALSLPAQTRPAAQTRPVIALGDSVTLGIRPRPRVRAVDRFSNLLAARLRRPIRNAGVGGDTTRDLLARLGRDVLNHSPRAVLIMAGLNDAAYVDPAPGRGITERDTPRVPLAEFERNLAEMVERTKRAGAKPILLTPNPMTRRYVYQRARFYQDHDINDGLAPFAEAVRRVARTHGACLADVHADWLSRRQHSRWLPDGLHPNPAGHRRIADLVWQRCRESLR